MKSPFNFKLVRKFLWLCSLGVVSTSTLSADSSFKLPEYQVTTLSNGLKVYLMEQHEVPMLDINILVSSGATSDQQLAGEAQATAQSLLLGTQKLTKAQLEETLEFVGAEVNASASLEFSGLSASFLAKDGQKILPILADILQRPAFSEDEFGKFKQRHIDDLKQRKERPNSVAGDYFKQLVFADHPYSSIVDGTQDSIQNLSVEKIQGFYQQHYIPQNTAIVAVGDFSSKEMLAQIKTLFGEWKVPGVRKSNTSDAKKAPTGLTKAKVLLVNKSDSRQSTFVIGGTGIPRKNEDYVALQVINTILGGRFSSWLNSELRINSGLTYGARSNFATYKHAGSFYISTYTDVKTTEKAMDMALETYSRLWKQGIDEETLDSAKAYVKGQYPPRYETSGQLARLLGSMHVYGFDESFINNFQNNVDSLTLEKTKMLINKYFPQENLQILVIGKAEAIRDIVKKYGEVKEVEITKPGFDI